ncbi:TPA: hypothetical protein N0F65_012587 [Lagenidium giganteum]|uniref:SIS domain-containing protein n=1 Tax=Lagenidium giganteum TaxID=4803 RepID=A0AAV2YQ62_9STRA|nr:TPA: hypothetical protein N0F65_012587 [Lagenidium giganteum]
MATTKRTQTHAPWGVQLGHEARWCSSDQTAAPATPLQPKDVVLRSLASDVEALQVFHRRTACPPDGIGMVGSSCCGWADVAACSVWCGEWQELHELVASDAAVQASLRAFMAELVRCHSERKLIYVTGIGKSGIVARRLASTLSSISIRSQWIHGCEWIHGELGSLKPGDVVSSPVSVSSVTHASDAVLMHCRASGNTSELVALPPMFRRIGCSLVSIVGSEDSSLARQSDIVIRAPAQDRHDCPVPARSIVLQEAISNAIVEFLVDQVDDRDVRFRRNHPGGAIGDNYAARTGTQLELNAYCDGACCHIFRAMALPQQVPGAASAASAKSHMEERRGDERSAWGTATLAQLQRRPPPTRIQQQQHYDLFNLLLPNEHEAVRRGKGPMWEAHFDRRKSQPARPQSSNGAIITKPGQLTKGSSVCSPRQARAITSPPSSARKDGQTGIGSGFEGDGARTPRSQGVPMAFGSRLEPHQSGRDVAGLPTGLDPAATTRHQSSPLVRLRRDDDRAGAESPVSQSTSNGRRTPERSSLPIDTSARDHLEVNACMLAYMNRIDVEDLQQTQEYVRKKIDQLKAQRRLTHGGILDDGSVLETTRRKTTVLLRHLFALEDRCSDHETQQMDLLYDVVEGWTCREGASSDEVGMLWDSINAHIEQSYILRRKLVTLTDPDPFSMRIAMDCLKKLPQRLPQFQRVLDVVIVVLEAGLLAPMTEPMPEDNHDNTPLSTRNRQFYFEVCGDLNKQMERLREANDTLQQALTKDEHQRAKIPLRQQVMTLLDRMANEDPLEKETLFLAFLRTNMELLACLACGEVLKFFLRHPNADKKQLFYSLLMTHLPKDETKHLLVEVTNARLTEFRIFVQENIDAVEKILLEPFAAARTSSEPGALPTTTLFRQLVERQPSLFASILWQSPFLTSHVFQDSQHLVVRILEQNIYIISQVLLQRGDVLLSLLSHTLKDNTNVLEEFLLNHPKAFADILLNRPAGVAATVKANPTILTELMTNCRQTLARVLLSSPDVLSHILKTTPELLSATIREDPQVLSLAFSLVPQCLSDVLEKHPEHFLDIAHRKPMLVARMFSKYPDLLLEPLEANPSVFSNFLLFHRKFIPDLSDDGINPAMLQLDRPKRVEKGTQTEKKGAKATGKQRVMEKLARKTEEIRACLRAHAHKLTPPTSSTQTTAGSTSNDGSSQPGSSAIMTPSQMMGEMARMYYLKILGDVDDDVASRKRAYLSDFLMDRYTQELGFKSLAKKKIASLLHGAKQCEAEIMRVKWFLRFCHVHTSTSSGKHDQLHPAALDFYLLVLQMLLPLEYLQYRLGEELFRPCMVTYLSVKELVESDVIDRMLQSSEQAHELLTTMCERENMLHGGANNSHHIGGLHSAMTPTSVQLSTLTMHIDDVMDSLMEVWIDFIEREREEWTVLFQRMNPDGSGVIHYQVFADTVRSRVPTISDRALTKCFHSFGEENDLGEYFLIMEDFTLGMSALQEQDALRQFSPALVS